MTKVLFSGIYKSQCLRYTLVAMDYNGLQWTTMERSWISLGSTLFLSIPSQNKFPSSPTHNYPPSHGIPPPRRRRRRRRCRRRRGRPRRLLFGRRCGCVTGVEPAVTLLDGDGRGGWLSLHFMSIYEGRAGPGPSWVGSDLTCCTWETLFGCNLQSILFVLAFRILADSDPFNCSESMIHFMALIKAFFILL